MRRHKHRDMPSKLPQYVAKYTLHLTRQMILQRLTRCEDVLVVSFIICFFFFSWLLGKMVSQVTAYSQERLMLFGYSDI